MRAGDWRRALQVYEHMETSAIPRDAHCHAEALKACREGGTATQVRHGQITGAARRARPSHSLGGSSECSSTPRRLLSNVYSAGFLSNRTSNAEDCRRLAHHTVASNR